MHKRNILPYHNCKSSRPQYYYILNLKNVAKNLHLKKIYSRVNNYPVINYN